MKVDKYLIVKAWLQGKNMEMKIQVSENIFLQSILYCLLIRKAPKNLWRILASQSKESSNVCLNVCWWRLCQPHLQRISILFIYDSLLVVQN